MSKSRLRLRRVGEVLGRSRELQEFPTPFASLGLEDEPGADAIDDNLVPPWKRNRESAGVLIGFESEEDWLDYRLEPEFLRRIRDARVALREGRGVRLEELEE